MCLPGRLAINNEIGFRAARADGLVDNMDKKKLAMSDKSYDSSVLMPSKWDYRELWNAPVYIRQYLRHKGRYT